LQNEASEAAQPRTLPFVFDALDFVYLPSRDVAVDLKHFTNQLGAEFVFAIEAFGTRVAMVRLSAEPPALLLAGHLEGEQPVLVHRVTDLVRAITELEDRGVKIGARFEILMAPPSSSSAPALSASRSTN
jgi:hypothetical protein